MIERIYFYGIFVLIIIIWLLKNGPTVEGFNAYAEFDASAAEKAEFTGWEITCLGRPASNEAFNCGQLLQRWQIYREEQPLLLERTLFVGGSNQLQSAWGLGGATVAGTLVTTCSNVSAEQLREAIETMLSKQKPQGEYTESKTFDEPLLAVSALPELLVIRAFGQNAADVKSVFIGLWHLLRFAQTGQDAVAPRIWFS